MPRALFRCSAKPRIHYAPLTPHVFGYVTSTYVALFPLGNSGPGLTTGWSCDVPAGWMTPVSGMCHWPIWTLVCSLSTWRIPLPLLPSRMVPRLAPSLAVQSPFCVLWWSARQVSRLQIPWQWNGWTAGHYPLPLPGQWPWDLPLAGWRELAGLFGRSTRLGRRQATNCCCRTPLFNPWHLWHFLHTGISPFGPALHHHWTPPAAITISYRQTRQHYK